MQLRGNLKYEINKKITTYWCVEGGGFSLSYFCVSLVCIRRPLTSRLSDFQCWSDATQRRCRSCMMSCEDLPELSDRLNTTNSLKVMHVSICWIHMDRLWICVQLAQTQEFPHYICVCTKTNIDKVLRLERRELWLCETEFWSFVLLTACTDLPSSPFPSSGVWAEERNPQAAGVQKSRDRVFLQWVWFDLFTPLFSKTFFKICMGNVFIFQFSSSTVCITSVDHFLGSECLASLLMYGTQRKA